VFQLSIPPLKVDVAEIFPCCMIRIFEPTSILATATTVLIPTPNKILESHVSYLEIAPGHVQLVPRNANLLKLLRADVSTRCWISDCGLVAEDAGSGFDTFISEGYVQVGTVEAEVEGFYLLYGAVGPKDVGEGEERWGCRLEALEGRGSRSGLFDVVMSANWSPPA
jgi:hypothetical protein